MPIPSLDVGKLKGKVVLPNKRYKLGENKNERPWRITLFIQQDLIDINFKPVVYYVRGFDPHNACMMASYLWTKWEKFERDLMSCEYPDVADGQPGIASCVDEHDFRSAWEEVKRYNLPYKCAGDVKDPMAFTVLGRIDV